MFATATVVPHGIQGCSIVLSRGGYPEQVTSRRRILDLAYHQEGLQAIAISQSPIDLNPCLTGS